MNDIGKILPIEGYRVVMKGNLPADYAKSLTHLYQPLIGIHAIALYQTLLHDNDFQQDANVQTHHTLMNYMNVPLDDIYRARLKLEGIGLLKTFQSELTDYNTYTYELQPPFAPFQFFTDEMLVQLLYHHIGQSKFDMLKTHYVVHETKVEGTNITASFNDVFETVQPHTHTTDMSEQPQERHEKVAEPDFSWLEQILKQRMIPVYKVLTTANKHLISQMMTLYNLPEYEMEKALLWALTDENTLNVSEFKEACHDLFQNSHQQADVKLTEKKADSQDDTAYQPTTKEEQLIAELEKISPRQLLEDLSNGGQASGQDLKVIREVMTTQGLPSPVMNVLIHYVLLQSNMKLSKAYMETIASHWSRSNLKTAREAMAFARKKVKSQKNNTANKTGNRKNYQQSSSQEVVPDWFKERKKKKQQEQSNQNDTDTSAAWEETATLLQKYSKKK